MPLPSFLFLSTALFALRSFFSSSESDARSWDSYSQTTSQPSLFLLAILISFWRSLISCFPSATNLRTSDEFSTLPSIWVKMLFECDDAAFNLGQNAIRVRIQLELLSISLKLNRRSFFFRFRRFLPIVCLFPLIGKWCTPWKARALG